LRLGVFKTEQSAVFEEATEEAADADIVTLTGDARLEAADTTDHEFDADSRLGCFVKSVDYLRVHEAVDLGEDRRGLAGFGVRRLGLDEFHDTSRQVEGGDEEVLELGAGEVSGQDVEK